MCTSDCLLAFIAILFPPLPVWVKRGCCSADSVINIALCLLGYIPGLLHAWYIISVTPDYYEYERIVDVEAADGTTHTGRVRRHGGRRGGRTFYVDRLRNDNGAPGLRQDVPAQAPAAHNGIPALQAEQGYGTRGLVVNGQQGSSREDEVPPSYNEAIEGDYKVQKK